MLAVDTNPRGERSACIGHLTNDPEETGVLALDTLQMTQRRKKCVHRMAHKNTQVALGGSQATCHPARPPA